MMHKICFFLFFVFFLTAPVSFSAEIYRWTDEKGTVHFTDDPTRIPQRYSNQGKKIDVPEEKTAAPQPPPKPDVRSDRVKEYLREMDKKIEAKKKFERRISTLEEELVSIRERLKVIEELEREDFQYYQPFRDQRTGNWVRVGTPYYDERVRLDRRREAIEKELRPLHEELAKINRSL
jgi:type I site-specific restriction-modification system R (restriction) subunit